MSADFYTEEKMVSRVEREDVLTQRYRDTEYAEGMAV